MVVLSGNNGPTPLIDASLFSAGNVKTKLKDVAMMEAKIRHRMMMLRASGFWWSKFRSLVIVFELPVL
jgi:hypothetical protein